MPVAKDIMTKKVITVGPKDKAKDAIATVVKNRISGMPVVDEKGKVLGMLTQADLLSARATQSVESLMVSPAVTVAPTATLTTITNTLQKKKIKRVVVVDKDKCLLGVVSRLDLRNLGCRPGASGALPRPG